MGLKLPKTGFVVLVITIISWQSCWHIPCPLLSFLTPKEKAGVPTGVRSSYFAAGGPHEPVTFGSPYFSGT